MNRNESGPWRPHFFRRKKQGENTPGESDPTRRQFFGKAVLGTVAGILLVNEAQRLVSEVLTTAPKPIQELGDALIDTPSSIQVIEGEQLTKGTKSAVIGLPGQFIRNADGPMEALTSLSPLGVRMSAHFGFSSIDIPDLKKSIYERRLETDNSLDTLSWYCLSDGFDTAAELIPQIGKDFATDYVFLDCSPSSLQDAKGIPGALARLFKNVPDSVGTIFTALADIGIFSENTGSNLPQVPGELVIQTILEAMKPYYNSIASPPELASDQYEALVHSSKTILNFGKYVTEYNKTHKKPIKIVYLHPQNPGSDGDVNVLNAIAVLSNIIPNMQSLPIEGGAHSDPIVDPVGYNNAIDSVLRL